jgi:uncharacterized protein
VMPVADPTRAVVDTKVVVSRVVAPRGPIAQVMRLCEERRVVLIVSVPILDEYQRVLQEPDIRKLHRLSDAETNLIVDELRLTAEIVVATPIPGAIPMDPKDDKFVEAAVAGGAHYIVSGDKHLLALGSYDGIQIVSPALFVRLFEAG